MVLVVVVVVVVVVVGIVVVVVVGATVVPVVLVVVVEVSEVELGTELVELVASEVELVLVEVVVVGVVSTVVPQPIDQRPNNKLQITNPAMNKRDPETPFNLLIRNRDNPKDLKINKNLNFFIIYSSTGEYQTSLSAVPSAPMTHNLSLKTA